MQGSVFGFLGRCKSLQNITSHHDWCASQRSCVPAKCGCLRRAPDPWQKLVMAS